MAEGGTCQDTERNRLTKGHSHPGHGRGMDLSGHRKKLTEQGALTNWRRQKGLIRIQKATDRAKGTHVLKTAEGGTCQDTERNRLTKGHSHPGDGRGMDLSGQRKKLTKQGALTTWRRQREEFVRTLKEIDRARGTHVLETADNGTCQDTEGNRPSKGHSLPGDGRGRDLSGHRKEPTQRRVLTF